MKTVLASDFASMSDLAAFKRCKAKGHSDKHCFAFGDNGIGCWGDITAQLETPMCAIPPDDMIELFGSIQAAKHRLLFVLHNGNGIVCKLADRMPWRKNIKNGCGIDLNPAALKALGLTSPIRVKVEYNVFR